MPPNPFSASAMSFDVSSLSFRSQMAWVHPNEFHILNATQSKSRNLPFELLSTIFQHACSTFDEEPITNFHLVLRLVSTLWYDISQSTPQLWASVFLPPLHADNAHIRAQYLGLCLRNSGSLPLTLELRFYEELRDVGWGWFVSPKVDTVLEQNAHRIQVLRLIFPPHSWLEKLIPKMFQLASIHLLSPRDAPHQLDERLFLPKAANVNQITMFCPCLLDLRLECATASLTDVSLKQCPIDFVIEFLLRCPNLIDFHCWSHGPPSKVKDPRSMLTSPLVLNQLSSLTWSAGKPPYLSEWCNALFECVRFPALKRFSWEPCQRPYMVNLAELLPLFKFPNSVTTLQLDWIGFISTDATLNHFSALTDLTQLRFSNCDSFFVERAFTILSWGTDENDISFPKLTALIIDYHWATAATACMVFHVESGRNLVGMLRRRMGLIDQFTLTVKTARMTHHWDDETWDALRELKKDGLDLTIAEGGHPYNALIV